MPICSQTTVSGNPCRNNAMTGTDPPRCPSHMGLAGRKPRTALTDDVVEKLVVLLRAGNYVPVACRAVNVPERTFRQWLEYGRAGDKRYVAFAESIARAQATGEAANVAAIANAARTNWQAAAWLLERQHPERWGRVSVRARDEPIAEPAPTPPPDEFAEIDELAARRTAK